MSKKRPPFLSIILFAGVIAGLIAVYRGPGSTSTAPGAGRPVENFSLTALQGDAPLTLQDLTAQPVSILVFWASWCAECRAEMPQLLRLAREGRVPLFGVAYKDNPDKAAALLQAKGNPFNKVGRDDAGQLAVNWGIYGVPEIFIVRTVPNGQAAPSAVIAHHQVGAPGDEVLEKILLPKIRSLQNTK